MTTIYGSFDSGTITDAPLAIGATTITSPNFANLFVVAAPNNMWLTLDPRGVYGAPEIILVTAHAALAQTVTAVRGQQSTAARQHVAGTAWSLGLTAVDAPSNPNMLDNPQFTVNQRGTTTTTITAGTRQADRWTADDNLVGTASFGVSTRASFGASVPAGRPSPATIQYVQMNTASGALGADAYLQLFQRFEGQDLQHLKWSTAEAQPVTLSFDVYCSVSQTFIAELFNFSANRNVSATYTTTAGAFKTVTLTFPGDTGGTYFPNDANNQFQVNFALAGGSTFTSGTANTAWATNVAANRWAGLGTTFANTLNAQFAVTNVKFEVGSVATPLVPKAYSEELRRCQRYFRQYELSGSQIGGTGQAFTATEAMIFMPLSVPMRPVTITIPTNATIVGTLSNVILWNAGTAGLALTSLTYFGYSSNHVMWRAAVASGLVAGNATTLLAVAAVSLQHSAEI